MKPLRHGAEGEKLGLNQRQDSLFVLGLFSLQIQKLGKIGVDGFLGGDVGITGHGRLSRADSGGEEGRDRFFPLKNVDHALLCRPPALPVAPSGGLQNGVQPGLLPEHDREVHIHPRLDKGGRHHPAGQALPQATADLPQLLLSMIRAHEGGEMKVACPIQSLIYLLGRLSGVDNAQDLTAGAELYSQLIPSQLPLFLKGHPAKHLPLASIGWAQLLHGDLWEKFPEELFQGRLCGRTEDCRDAVVSH